MEMPLRLRASSRRSPMDCMGGWLRGCAIKVNQALRANTGLRGKDKAESAERAGVLRFGARGRSHAVEVHEDFAGAGAVFGADDAFVFHLVHDAGGAVVADAQATLDHGGGGAFGGADDVEGLAEELLV